MTTTHLPKHRREDGVPPSPILDIALVTRRASGTTHARAAKEGA